MTASAPPREPRVLRVPHAGWRVIAAKELGDHLLSVRFIVLLVVLGLAAAIPLYFAADIIRAAAPEASGSPAVFLALFTIGSQDYTFLRVDSFVGDRRAAPRPGLRLRRHQRRALRGDAATPAGAADLSRRRHQRQVRGRAWRSSGSCCWRSSGSSPGSACSGSGSCRAGRGDRPPRGVDPRHVRLRRAVAGVRAAAVGARPARGDVRADRVRRLVPAVRLRRPDRDHRGRAVSPVTGATIDEQIGQAQTQQFITRLLPSKLYSEVTKVLLNPTSDPQADLPGSLGQAPAGRAADPDPARLRPEPAAGHGRRSSCSSALTVVCFALAYVAFMRQEVRA